MNLSDAVMTPMLSDELEVDKSLKPHCWKTVYYLLDLYATMPETKTISHRFSVAPDVIDGYRAKKMELKASDIDIEKGTQERTNASTSTPVPSESKPRELSTSLICFLICILHDTRFGQISL